MKLLADWKKVLRKAWSVRFAVLSATLSGIEIGVQLLASARPTPYFAMAAAVSSMAAGIARVVAQPKMSDAQR